MERSLEKTSSLYAFTKMHCNKNPKNFFIKKQKYTENGEQKEATFFTMAHPLTGERTKGLIAQTIDHPELLNKREALESGNYEVSWFTITDDDGESRETWLIHNKSNIGEAGEDYEMD